MLTAAFVWICVVYLMKEATHPYSGFAFWGLAGVTVLFCIYCIAKMPPSGSPPTKNDVVVGCLSASGDNRRQHVKDCRENLSSGIAIHGFREAEDAVLVSTSCHSLAGCGRRPWSGEVLHSWSSR
jgi:hypothetical protein